MTEKEAANRLCELLNEIEEAGHQVYWNPVPGGHDGLGIGDFWYVAEPPSEGEPWEVREQ